MIPGVTGEFFGEQTVDALAAVLDAFDDARYHPHTIREHAIRFGVQPFKERLYAVIESRYAEHRQGLGALSGRAGE